MLGVFSVENSEVAKPYLFKGNTLNRSHHHLHLSLDLKLHCDLHLKVESSIFKHYIALLRKLTFSLLMKPLPNIHEAFTRQVDYCNVIHDQSRNEKFKDTLVSLQCNAILKVTDSVRRTFWKKMYDEFGLDHLSGGYWIGRLRFPCRIYLINH